MEIKNVWKHAISNKVNVAKQLVGGKVDYMKDFTNDHPYVTGVLIGLVGLVVLQTKVIDAADEVIGELGGWD